MSAEVVVLDEQRARYLTERIRDAADSLWALLLEAHEGRAWAALGYPTWEAYVRTEFDMSRSHAYRMLDQARVIRELESIAGVSRIRDVTMESAQDLKPHLQVVKDAIRQAVEDVPEEQRADIVSEVLEQERQRVIRRRREPHGRPRETGPAEIIVDDADEMVVWTPEEEQLRAHLGAGRTVVANFKRHGNVIEWAAENGLYERIDRNSRWGNPFVLPDDGDRTTVIANYAERYLPAKPSLEAKLSGLKGKLLCCWCAPDACHGDVLVRLVEASS